METSPLPLPLVTWAVATSTAANRSVKEFDAASTSTILALGAMACAHSISRAASCPHPQLAGGCEPLAKIFLKQPLAVVQAGRMKFGGDHCQFIIRCASLIG